MGKEKKKEQVNRKEKITASVMSFEEGLQKFEDVSFIRIKSKDYTMLIMEDHTSALGEIEGSVAIVTADDEIRFDSIKGFFEHTKNHFSLLITKIKGEQHDESANQSTDRI